MMAVYGMDLVAAIQFVQSQRFCIALDDQMKGLLLSFQDILEAQRAVRKWNTAAIAPVPVTQNPTTFDSMRRNSKRHIEDTMDEEMKVDVSGEMDDGRPFLDRDDR
jgi:hypothetical protein